jgi:acetolactate synthase-1/2/3 large subunit
MEREQTDAEVLSEPLFSRCPALRPAPDQQQVEAAAEFLQTAERPVIVAGNGAAISDASVEILALAERLAIPVATSVSCNGLMPADHPLNMGSVGTYSRWCANQCVAEADLVLFIGSGAGDQITNNWTLPRFGTKVIQIDIDPTELGRNYPNICSLAGDAKVATEQLTQALTERRSETAWSRRGAELARAWRAEVESAKLSNDLPIRPERLCHEISLSLPEDAIIVSCTGNSAIWSGTMIDLTKPNQRYIRAAGGSLGWAFPASLGVKCGCPDRPVICFTGDGGLYYHLSELETAARWGIATVVVVNNNGGYGQCLRGIRSAYGDRAGKKEDLFRFKNVNLAKLAQEMGCEGIRVENPGQIGSAITEAVEMNRPVLVEVMTDINCLSPVPWNPEWA